MKEIKFRVYTKEYERIANVDRLQLNTDGTIQEVMVIVGDLEGTNNDEWIFLDGEDIELMQSTGLKDKRGTEIYEKDIVKFSNRDSRYKSKGEVVWWQGEAAFLIKCDNEIYKHFNEVSELEVIDNIYENPELLKDKK